MSKACWSAALLVVLLATTSRSVALAKPPDLPAENDVRCREAREEPEPWRSLLGWDVPTTRANGVAPRDDGDLDLELSESAQKARALYEAAQRCTRAGNLDRARARLREAHMANPTCHYGQRAIQQLLEMEADEAGTESELPLPPRPQTIRRPLSKETPSSEEPQSDDPEANPVERSFRRVRDTTEPLGMVRVQTY